MRMLNKIKWIALIGLTFLALLTPVTEAASNDSSSKGSVKYKGNDWTTPPVDPEKPGELVDPGGEIVKTEGPLRLDLIPKLSFGPQAISDKDQTYYVNAQLFKSETTARANYIQVTDNRGSLTGWQLSVRQETQFKNDQAKNKELSGAILSFDKQWANSAADQEYRPTIVKDAIKISEIGASYPIAVAEQGKGSGTWTIEFGSSGEVEGIENTLSPVINADGKPVTDSTVGHKPMYKNSAISLYVPGKTEKEPVKYGTILTWTIAAL